MAGLNLTKRLRGMLPQLKEIGAERDRLERRLEQAKQRRELLDVLPLPKDDFAAMLGEYVDVRAGAFAEQLRRVTTPLMRKPHFDPAGPGGIALLGADVDGGHMHRAGQAALYGLLAGPIKDAIRKTIDEWPDYPEDVGPTRAERKVELEKLNKEIADLESQLDELHTAAQQAGVRL